MATARRWADGVMATGAAAVALVHAGRKDGARAVVVGAGRSPGVDAVRAVIPGVTVVGADAVADVCGGRHVVVDGTSLSVPAALAVVGAVLDDEAAGRFAGQLQLLATTVRVRPERSPPEVHPLEGAVSAWVPVLSEGAGDALATLYDALRPDDVYPVLPFPARDVRRADDLLLEHRRLLFERIGLDPGAFVHAREDDPFDLYRSLTSLAQRQAASFRGLVRSEVVVTPDASLLGGLGAFLAARETGIRIVGLAPDDGRAAGSDPGELACVWLAGDPYRP